MEINIAPGNHFSQLSLVWQTNKFFSKNKKICGYKKFFTSKEKNYTLQLKKKYVVITLSNASTQNDYILVKNYIENIFKNKAIGIFSTIDIPWISEIQNVTIYKIITPKKAGEYKQ